MCRCTRHSTGQLARCCGAAGLGLSRMSTRHGQAVPPACRVPQRPWQELTRHSDPGRSPLSVGNNCFSHCPQMLGLLPAISARPSVPPSFPPALLPGWMQRTEPTGLPWEPLCGSHHCAVCLARRPPSRDDLCCAAGLCQYGSSGGQDAPPGDSAMPGLRHKMQRGR